MEGTGLAGKKGDGDREPQMKVCCKSVSAANVDTDDEKKATAPVGSSKGGSAEVRVWLRETLGCEDGGPMLDKIYNGFVKELGATYVRIARPFLTSALYTVFKL